MAVAQPAPDCLSEENRRPVLESADAGQEDAGAGAVADAAEAVDEGPATAVSGPDPVDEEELTGAGAEDVVLTDVCDAVEERVGRGHRTGGAR